MFTILHDEEIHRLAPGASYLDCLRSMLEHVEMDRKKANVPRAREKKEEALITNRKRQTCCMGFRRGGDDVSRLFWSLFSGLSRPCSCCLAAWFRCYVV